MSKKIDPWQLLEESTEALERVGCQFFACPGPSKPYKQMATCFICDQIRRNKKSLKDKENESNKT